ncbi:MAG: hypothetical protein LIO79_02410 [Rikenellaceae bacterium]|nr:hypothetical protein [Rikenellaceae bacterium]
MGFHKDTVTFILFTLAVLLCSRVRAQDTVTYMYTPDTIVKKSAIDRYNRFYETLEEKSSKSKFMNMIYKAAVTDTRRTEELPENPILVKEIGYFENFTGKTIRNISIFRNNVFDDINSDKNIYDFLNRVHVVTNENRIRRALFFNEGDYLDPTVMVQNQQFLRSQNFFSQAYILVVSDPEDENLVDVYVVTRDKWTINVAYSSAFESKRYYLSIYDDNFLGSGNRLGIRTYNSYEKPVYGGNMVEFTMNNMFGSFFDLEVIAGKGYKERDYAVSVSKPFLLSTDYMAGGSAEHRRYFEYQVLIDTAKIIKKNNFEVWGGKSWYLPSIKHSFFISSGYRNVKFLERPEVTADSNSYYHSGQYLMFSTGFYRESYYKGNMIYGFGTTEDIPYGYKFQFTGGRYWGEFADKWYGFITFAAGRQTNLGYIRGEIHGNGFVNSSGVLRQTSIGLNFGYFTNIFDTGRSFLRQFVDMRYTKGFARDKGEGEMLTFYDLDSPHGFTGDRMLGNNRMMINTETVVFSPLYFLGFRFAFFGFIDMAWIGDKNFVYANDFYTAVGAGVRIKNERLVFNTIQIRVGFALNKNGFADYRHYRYTHATRFQEYSYKPENPRVTDYR